MIGFLRFVGVTNAAVWLGASIFFTVGIAPAFFSAQMVDLLSRPFAGAAVQIVMDRYFLMHEVCAVIAIFHLIAEALYSGKVAARGRILLLLGILSLALIGSLGLQPKMKSLHGQMHTKSLTQEERDASGRSFRLWHGISQVMNILMIAGVLAHQIRVARPPDTFRYQIRF